MDVGNFLAKVLFEHSRIIRADRVSDNDVQSPVVRYPASNMAHETRETVSPAEQEAGGRYSTIYSRSNDWYEPEQVGNCLYPGREAASAYGISQIREDRERACFRHQRFNRLDCLLCARTRFGAFGGEDDEQSLAG